VEVSFQRLSGSRQASRHYTQSNDTIIAHFLSNTPGRNILNKKTNLLISGMLTMLTPAVLLLLSQDEGMTYLHSIIHKFIAWAVSPLGKECLDFNDVIKCSYSCLL
jgi:hypothetical protein